MNINWKGVFPAITTPFRDNYSIDHAFYAKHGQWLIDAGCHGLVPCGSLGEGAALSSADRVECVRTMVSAVGDRVPIIPGIAALSTHEAVIQTQEAEKAGASGFMVLPPYAYSTDWREMKAHVAAVLGATGLPCMLYNNPLSYKTDFLPEHIAELAAEFPNLEAVKESSSDVRRIAAIRALVGDRLQLLVGVDDLIVEAIRSGAVGWIAGLVNAFPRESVALWRYSLDGKTAEADALYRWFLPMLRLDTVPKLVQLIKLAQLKVGMGTEIVRGPRLPVIGIERVDALRVIEEALVSRPTI